MCLDRVSDECDKVHLCRGFRELHAVDQGGAVGTAVTDEGKSIDMIQDNGRDDLLKYTAPAIARTAVKNLIKSGEQFEGACLEASQSLIIG